MNNELFKSERYFTVFDFSISHGQLLFRSSKNKDFGTNIDIIFYGVKYIQLTTSLHGVTIGLTKDSSSLSYYDSVKSFLENIENNLFQVESAKEAFFIAASFFKVYENTLEFNETSLGMAENKGREKQIGGS